MYDITYSIHVTSCPLYLWHHIHSVWQHKTVLLIICVTSFAWHHMQMGHDITPTVSDIAPTLSLSSQISTNFIHTFVWHRTQYMCDIICTLYNIISPPHVITLLYLWHHSLYIWNHIQYVGPHTHYTCDITAPNRCHDSRSIDNITHTLYYITLR